MAGHERLSTRRTPSGPFSRLRSSPVDPLDSVGLPSKGDTRLHDFKIQEEYYGIIVERYTKFCADSGNVRELDRRFASLSTSAVTPPETKSNEAGPHAARKERSNGTGKLQKPQAAANNARHPSSTATSAMISADSMSAVSDAPSSELATILHAMRKLRESIVSTSRRDAFAQHAYAFIIRASILVRRLESYHGALLYLLSSIHPHTPLSPSELREFVGYHILDLACRQGELQAAFEIRFRYKHEDRRVGEVLKALVHDDWVSFWRLRRAVDGYQRAMLGWADERTRTHALKCLGVSYFTAERDFVEKSTDLEWEELVKECKVGWELQDDKVTIRRPKVK